MGSCSGVGSILHRARKDYLWSSKSSIRKSLAEILEEGANETVALQPATLAPTSYDLRMAES